jgi:hypothetical protein
VPSRIGRTVLQPQVAQRVSNRAPRSPTFDGTTGRAADPRGFGSSSVPVVVASHDVGHVSEENPNQASTPSQSRTSARAKATVAIFEGEAAPVYVGEASQDCSTVGKRAEAVMTVDRPRCTRPRTAELFGIRPRGASSRRHPSSRRQPAYEPAFPGGFAEDPAPGDDGSLDCGSYGPVYVGSSGPWGLDGDGGRNRLRMIVR